MTGLALEVQHPLAYGGNDTEDMEVLTEWMRLYGTDVLNVAYSYVRHYHQAQDLTQETFLRAFRKMHTFRNDSSVRTWLLSIAVNCCKDYLRSWQYRKVHPEEELEGACADSGAGSTPEHLVIHELENQELWQVVEELPEKYREVLVLFYLRELSGQEIAEVLGTSEQNVRTRLYRARGLLREALEGKGWNHES